MSSLISLRSYQRRRKSAGARLERTQTSPGVPLDPAGYSSKLVPVLGGHREKRVKSARETRREQEASDIFPELLEASVDPEWGRTKYSEDFCQKTVSPVHIRPISPTRMNNPHPSKVRRARVVCANQCWGIRDCQCKVISPVQEAKGEKI